MLNSDLQDYRSKHLHGGRTKGTASRGGAFFNARADPSGGTSRGPPRNNGRGGHRGSAFKRANFKKDQRVKAFSNFNTPSGSGLKKPYPDAIVIQDGDIDPNLVVSFSDNESIDDKDPFSAQQLHEDCAPAPNYLFQTGKTLGAWTRITIPWETSMEDIKTHPAQ